MMVVENLPIKAVDCLLPARKTGVSVRLVAGGALKFADAAFLCEGDPYLRHQYAFHIQTYYVHLYFSFAGC